MYTPGPQMVSSPQTGVQPPQMGVVNQPEIKQEPKPKAPAKSKKDDLGSFIQQLIGLAAYVHQLQVQSHLLHFNYECSNFLSVHKFLGKQYEKHQDQFDAIGEYVRSMDYYLPMCHEGLMAASPEFKHCPSYKPQEMLTVYYKNLEELGMKSKKMIDVARKVGAPDVENYLAELVGAAFKDAWFIKSILRNG
jgi:DNA-binding ferritin-like protein